MDTDMHLHFSLSVCVEEGTTLSLPVSLSSILSVKRTSALPLSG